MKYYKIMFSEFPTIVFAHRHQNTNYDFKFLPRKNFLEITYIQTGDVKNGSAIHKAPFVHVNTYTEPLHFHSDEPLHIHYTFSVTGEFELSEISEAELMDIWKNNTEASRQIALSAILPECVFDKKIVDKIEHNIKKIIIENTKNTPEGRLICIISFLEILSILTEYCIKSSASSKSGISPSSIVYRNKILDYVSKNIQNKITITEIADYLQFSCEHTCRIFKEASGMSIIEYINSTKINYAKQLLENSRLSVFDIISSVGISDEKYFYRIFKKYTGMTVSEYKKTISIKNV